MKNDPYRKNVSLSIKILKRLIIGLTNEKMAWFELFIVCTISLFMWGNLYQGDIEQTQYYFFWPMLGPLVIALRYGFAKGMMCFVLTIICMKFAVLGLKLDVYFSVPVAVGAALVTMVAEEFADHWYTINQRYELNYRYMEQKLQSFTQNYHLLKISHDQLEQRAAGKLMSLRTSVQILQQAALSETSNRLEKLGHECLHILSDVVGMYEAGIYVVKNN